jgi:hypothetical protein
MLVASRLSLVLRERSEDFHHAAGVVVGPKMALVRGRTRLDLAHGAKSEANWLSGIIVAIGAHPE